MSDYREDKFRQLDEIATRYNPSDPVEHFDFWLKRLEVQCAIPWFTGTCVLEMGCATGESSLLIAPLAEEYHIVEGSAQNIEIARSKVPSATFTLSLWEDYESKVKFSDIVLFGTLEHARDPLVVLRNAREWLQPGGRIHISVPNGLSIHRLVGVELGMLPEPTHLADGDRSQGHERNYTVDTLRRDVGEAGLRVVDWRPIFLKVLSNRQMLGWDWELIEALHRVAERFPEHGAEIYMVAERA